MKQSGVSIDAQFNDSALSQCSSIKKENLVVDVLHLLYKLEESMLAKALSNREGEGMIHYCWSKSLLADISSLKTIILQIDLQLVHFKIKI